MVTGGGMKGTSAAGRPIARNRGPAARPKKPCNYWRQDGACPFGDRCRYGHEEGDKGISLLSAALDGKDDDDAPTSPTQSIVSSEGSWRKTNTNTPFNSVKQCTLRDLGQDGKDTFGGTISKYTLSQTATPISPADSASNWRKPPGNPIWRRGGANLGQRQSSIQKQAVDDEEQERERKAREDREAREQREKAEREHREEMQRQLLEAQKLEAEARLAQIQEARRLQHAAQVRAYEAAQQAWLEQEALRLKAEEDKKRKEARLQRIKDMVAAEAAKKEQREREIAAQRERERYEAARKEAERRETERKEKEIAARIAQAEQARQARLRAVAPPIPEKVSSTQSMITEYPYQWLQAYAAQDVADTAQARLQATTAMTRPTTSATTTETTIATATAEQKSAGEEDKCSPFKSTKDRTVAMKNTNTRQWDLGARPGPRTSLDCEWQKDPRNLPVNVAAIFILRLQPPPTSASMVTGGGMKGTSSAGRPIARNRGPGARPKKPCHYWRQHGACPYGDGCWYGHEEGDNGILLVSAALDGKDNDDAPTSPAHSIASSGTAEWSPAWTKPSKGPSRQTNTTTLFNSIKQSTLINSGQDGKDTFGTTSKYTLTQPTTSVSSEAYAFRWLKPPGNLNEQKEREGEEAEARRKKEAAERREKEIKVRQKREEEREKELETRRQKEVEAAQRKKDQDAEERRRTLKIEQARLRNEEKLAREKAIIQAAKRRHREQQRDQWKTESASVETHVVADTNLVMFTAGMDVRKVVGGFDLCRVTVKDLPTDVTSDEIDNVFRQQGFSPSEYLFMNLTEVQGKCKAVIVAARAAVDRCLIAAEKRGSPIKFRDRDFTFEVSRNASGNDEMTVAAETQTFLTVSWSAPSTMIVAIYDSKKQAEVQVQRLDGTLWNGRRMGVSKVEGLAGQCHVASRLAPRAVVLCCAPGTVSSPEFCSFLGTSDVKLPSSAVYNLTEVYGHVREHLRRLPGVQMDTYKELDSLRTDATIKIGFSTWKEAKQGHDTMDKKRLKDDVNFPLLRSVLPCPVQYSIEIPKPQFLVQKTSWDELSSIQEEANLKFEDRGDIFIHVLGYSKKAAGSLKVRIERLAAGERLDATLWHSSFAEHAGKDFFERILKEKNVYVRNDITRRRLSLCGDRNAFNKANQMIKDEVGRLTLLSTTMTLDPEYIREFMAVGWRKLKELIGQDNVVANTVTPRQVEVTVRGGLKSTHHLRRLVNEAHSTFLDPDDTGVEFCSLCEEATSIPEKLGCGHSYCPGCISQFLASATNLRNKSFPLICQGNEGTCKVPIPIPFIRRFLHPQLFENLVEVAFIAYLDKKPQDLRFCKTPKCIQMYSRRSKSIALECPGCSLTVCAMCGEEAHEHQPLEGKESKNEAGKNEGVQDKTVPEERAGSCVLM
ncbi:hypothetical protein BDN70DRAFT_892071 [Pholiota conissans]|uniref:C3H1-type domain-containing protein n=1 Tax=Pholiota conissans TaxID=109636 RepID=A0A9P5Z8R9_9AGAR|nr:hypothetical protein BDN70DRAFT_892071 [Pholiota conissans]